MGVLLVNRNLRFYGLTGERGARMGGSISRPIPPGALSFRVTPFKARVKSSLRSLQHNAQKIRFSFQTDTLKFAVLTSIEYVVINERAEDRPCSPQAGNDGLTAKPSRPSMH
jgi:hypothetical protein